jgi:tRNA pseudouridine55 synthase
MGRRGRRGRRINGILLLDKPTGITSNGALQRVKRMFNAQKAGHTGSLDPLASGLLPLCFGDATKLSAYLLDADKRYWVKIKLGERTDTADADGTVVETRPVPALDTEQLQSVLDGFLGEIDQIPPMYSAVRVGGERLYNLARAGVEVERQPRRITIHSLELLGFENDEIELNVHCSKGTYVRTLAEDVGEQLGCGAHVCGLRRTGVGPFAGDKMLTMEQIEAAMGEEDALDALLIPLDSALADRPQIELSKDLAYYVSQGQPVFVPQAPTSGWVRLYGPDQQFLGVGEILDDGRVGPRRLLR